MKTFKAQAELLLAIVIIVVIAVTAFIAAFVLDAIHTGAPVLFQNTTNPQGQTIYNNGTQAVSTFDSLIVFIFIGIILGMAVSAMFVEAHPAFAFIGIFTLILLLIITAVVHNVYFDIIQSSVFAGGVTPSGATVIFFEYLPLFGAVAWALIMVATYGKGVSGAGASGSGAQQRAYG